MFLEYLQPHQVHALECYGMERRSVGKDWSGLTMELIDHIELHGHRPVVAVGHSFGGVLAFWAARRRPDLIERVIMLDSPIFKTTRRRLITLSKELGFADRVIPPAIKTKKRRTNFASREEAWDYLSKRRLFKGFAPEALQGYVQHGLVEQEDGTFTLKIPKELELAIFCACPGRFGPKRIVAPSHFVYAGRREVLRDDDLAWLKKAFAHTEFAEMSDAGHMFPMQEPERSAELIRQIIETGSAYDD